MGNKQYYEWAKASEFIGDEDLLYEVKDNTGKLKYAKGHIIKNFPDEYAFYLLPVTLMSKEEGDKWISVKDRLPDYEQVFPKKVQRVLILMNYEKWGRNEERIEIANLHFADEPQHFGGPNSLTGQGYLTGLYYSIPAIINPECVTHWQPLPSPPKQALNQLNKQL